MVSPGRGSEWDSVKESEVCEIFVSFSKTSSEQFVWISIFLLLFIFCFFPHIFENVRGNVTEPSLCDLFSKAVGLDWPVAR